MDKCQSRDGAQISTNNITSTYKPNPIVVVGRLWNVRVNTELHREKYKTININLSIVSYICNIKKSPPFRIELHCYSELNKIVFIIACRIDCIQKHNRQNCTSWLVGIICNQSYSMWFEIASSCVAILCHWKSDIWDLRVPITLLK